MSTNDGLGSKLTLYYFDGCPYCDLVRRTIRTLAIEHIELKDIWADPLHRNDLLQALGRATVPVLRIESADGVVRWMPESRDIVAYLREQQASAQNHHDKPMGGER